MLGLLEKFLSTYTYTYTQCKADCNAHISLVQAQIKQFSYKSNSNAKFSRVLNVYGKSSDALFQFTLAFPCCIEIFIQDKLLSLNTREVKHTNACLHFYSYSNNQKKNHIQINFNSTTALFHFPDEKFDSNSLTLDKLHQFEYVLSKVMSIFRKLYTPTYKLIHIFIHSTFLT